MRKLLTTALPTAAIGALLLLPAAPAQAQTPACGMASDVINSAFIAAPDHKLDREAQQALSTKLQSIYAEGAEKEAIDAFVGVVNDPNAGALDQAFGTFKSNCKA
ncbi:hypothetical protein D5S18_15430 [Nocardia panacis]|uniref:Hemophore-related protein n=1 Tax=Nocardia panacis TaxID=2340916 RepID=A0A3A4KNY7_9NOCA|nr:hypothetical protein [Nocardia panacis]RJO74830.1 hypothetical protein D5S18_15430 [Nocardia panacis]